MSRSGNQLARREREEIARAIRLLLRDPLISVHLDPAGFDLIRKRRQPLTAWFDYYCGWRLVVEPRHGYARLVKVRGDAGPSRPARRRRGGRAPFDRRRYTLFCLACAELLATPVTTIGMIARSVVQAAAAEPDVPEFDPVRADERSAFVDALKLLEHYGVLAATDGMTDAYLKDADAKVLYRVDTTRIMRLLATPVPPSRTEDGDGWPDPAGLAVESRYGASPKGGTAGPAAPTSNQRNLWARHSLLRRLLDDPVVYRKELTPDQAAFLASPAGRRTVREAAERAGFVLEERAEGLLLVDAEGLATETRFPDDGSPAQVAALLLLDLLAEHGPLSTIRLKQELDGILERFPGWARAYRSEGGPARLLDDALDVLALFGLVHRTEGMTLPLPAAARYRVALETT
ncbi:TIGR02678 family protein [Actinocorallia sp. B10E7]|uniref:TIGR02678 family protein n=1 Tax=Actinocorallia sp. B10E7 TaxID=3153558 RepID=UPI00325F5BA5